MSNNPINTINIQQLPLEVLQYIFILSGNPNFPLVSQNFYKAANSQISVKTQWLLCKFKADYKKALFRGLKWKFFSKEILNQLDNLYQQSLRDSNKQSPVESSCGKRPVPQCQLEVHYQQNPRNRIKQLPTKIPCDKRPIPQWFFYEEDLDGRLLEFVEILLERNASPDEPNGYPIIKSAQMGNIEMAKLLIKYKANVKIYGNLALQISVSRLNFEMVKLLLKNGAEPDKALRISVEKGNHDMAKLLLDYGAQPDAVVLQISVEKGDYAMVKLLLDYGAQPNAKCLEIAARMNCNKIYELLKEHGAVEDLNVVNAFQDL